MRPAGIVSVARDIEPRPRCVAGQGRADAHERDRPASTADPAKRPTGTPRPGTLKVPRQVSWLAGRRFLSVFPEPGGSSDDDGLRLAAYSCGGSAGVGLTAAPASLLALDFAIRETVTTIFSIYRSFSVNESLTGYTRFRAWP
jgi:hypothetical protein